MSIVCAGIPGYERMLLKDGQLQTRFAIIRMAAWRSGRGETSMHELTIRSRPVARMPLLPQPHADEAFGSWLHRCADAYFMPNREEFTAGVLALEGQRLSPGTWDWDCRPPPPLLDALARRSPYSVVQLNAMLVPVSPNVLR